MRKKEQAGVENLLDQDYQVSPGFGTAGISAFAGFKAEF